MERYQAIRRELEQYDPALAERPEIIALTKIDALDEATINTQREALAAHTNATVWAISSVSGNGLARFLDEVWMQLQALEPAPSGETDDDIWD